MTVLFLLVWSFEHAARVTILAESFSLTHFNPFQEQVLDATLAGKDSIIVQPTGSGKSLCFQFPPVYEQKKAIVVIPTVSLMNDLLCFDCYSPVLSPMKYKSSRGATIGGAL